MGLDEPGRILAGRKFKYVRGEALPKRQVDTPHVRGISGGVAVVEKYDGVAVPLQDPHVIGREGGPAGGHHIPDAVLMQRHDIRISLDNIYLDRKSTRLHS